MPDLHDRLAKIADSRGIEHRSPWPDEERSRTRKDTLDSARGLGYIGLYTQPLCWENGNFTRLPDGDQLSVSLPALLPPMKNRI